MLIGQKHGAPGRIRTLDLPLRRRLLYPLSYWCMPSTLKEEWSGRRDSNPRLTAWKAVALPTELRPLVRFQKVWSNSRSNRFWIITGYQSGGSRIRTYEGIRQQIYSLPQLAALVSPLPFPFKTGLNTLCAQVFYALSKGIAKLCGFFIYSNF